MSAELRYYFNRPAGVSLNPLNSDDMGNAILMKHLVGTLVRYANGGQFEPYLAERFEPTENGKIWTFRLRDGLKCQDGEPITAAGYIEGASKLFRTYAKQGPLPILSDIEGWNEFVEGQPLKGLTSSSHLEITFRFVKPAGPGFLEYLSMPYYGYFCRSNFAGNTWASETTVVSSGPYTLTKPIVDPTEVFLSLRENWPLNPNSAPKQVVYRTKVTDDSWSAKASIVQASIGWTQEEPSGFRRIWGPPDNIRATVLDGEGPSRFFAKADTRKAFQTKLLELRDRTPFNSKSATLASAFYAGSNPPTSSAPVGLLEKPSKPLLVFAPNSTVDETRYAVALTKTALDELGWPYTMMVPSETNGISVSDAYKRTKFDIRVTSVVAGSVIEPWVVEMMFCSNLGVSFPDPSKRICKFINSILRGEKSYSIPEAGAEVSRIVHDDAAVIPIYHGRSTWYFSNDLDVSKISGDLILPSFEDIGMKE